MTATTTRPHPAPALYKVADAVHVLRLSRSEIYEQIRAGRLRIVKQGRATLITAAAIADYISAPGGRSGGRPMNTPATIEDNPPRKRLTIPEVCAYLKVTEAEWNAWRAAGDTPLHIVGPDGRPWSARPTWPAGSTRAPSSPSSSRAPPTSRRVPRAAGTRRTRPRPTPRRLARRVLHPGAGCVASRAATADGTASDERDTPGPR